MAELSIVIPTFNEKENIRPLLRQIDEALPGVSWEAIFVDDDSPDGTTEAVRQISQSDPRVRCLQRIGRRGLSSATIEGMLASSAAYLAVMDADLQHDAGLLAQMLETIKAEGLDLVIGSRYIQGGEIGEWSSQRAKMSHFATILSRLVVKAELKDPMSGFFMLKRSFLNEVVRRLSGRGFKILLDICASSTREVRFKELPFVFGERLSGESKLGFTVIYDYGQLVAEKWLGRLIPTRFVLFALVGITGAAVHLTVLVLGLKIFRMTFVPVQTAATFLAMTSNYYLNNAVTFGDRKLKGFSFIKGLLSFYLACGIGAAVNICVAVTLFKLGFAWWVAGLVGVAVGSILNFATTTTFTWAR